MRPDLLASDRNTRGVCVCARVCARARVCVCARACVRACVQHTLSRWS